MSHESSITVLWALGRVGRMTQMPGATKDSLDESSGATRFPPPVVGHAGRGSPRGVVEVEATPPTLASPPSLPTATTDGNLLRCCLSPTHPHEPAVDDHRTRHSSNRPSRAAHPPTAALQVMKTMASKGRKLISGDTGARLMAELVPSTTRMTR